MNIRRFFSKLSVRTALFVTALMAVLLICLNVFVLRSGEAIFNDVYKRFTNQESERPPERIPFVTPYGIQWLILRHIPEGEPLTPREHFTNRFEVSLALFGIGALIGAVGIGLLTSRTITRPLAKVGKGMEKLHESKYALRLEESESDEVNGIIKEFNHLAAELQRVEELRKNVISDASHELRTPLASLMAQLEGIEDGVLPMDTARVQSLRQQADRLHQLTEKLQDYAYFRSQSIKLRKERVSLLELVHRVASDFSDALSHKQTRLVISIPEELTLDADPLLLERIIVNVIDNAIRYAGAKTITIAAAENYLRISDDGIGIPEQHLSDIFERFFRVEKSRSRETGGMGLGLSIVKEIVEAHGWQIVARKPDNGIGVEFMISFHSA